MQKLGFSTQALFLLPVVIIVALDFAIEPLKAVTLLVWVLIVAGLIAGAEMVFGKKGT